MPRKPPCSTGGPHKFSYYREPGTSSPTCVRCGATNPRYDRDRDTHHVWNPDVVASLERERLNNPRHKKAW